MDLFSEEYLAHYGILGMKWGVRRFQNPDGTYTDKGRERERKKYEAAGNKALKATKKAEKSVARAEKAQATAAKKTDSESAQRKAEKLTAKAEKAVAKANEKSATAEERTAAYKKALISSGSTEELMQFKGTLSSDEMQQAINRIDKDQKLKELSTKELSAGWYAADALMVRVNKLNSYAKDALNLYDNATKIKKIFEDKKTSKAEKAGNELVEKGTPAEILARQHELSDAQLKRAADRINSTNTLSSAATKNAEATKKGATFAEMVANSEEYSESQLSTAAKKAASLTTLKKYLENEKK